MSTDDDNEIDLLMPTDPYYVLIKYTIWIVWLWLWLERECLSPLKIFITAFCNLCGKNIQFLDDTGMPGTREANISQ